MPARRITASYSPIKVNEWGRMIGEGQIEKCRRCSGVIYDAAAEMDFGWCLHIRFVRGSVVCLESNSVW